MDDVHRNHAALVPDAVAAVVKMEVAYLFLQGFHAQWKMSLDASNGLLHEWVDHLDNAVVGNIDYQKFFSDDPHMEVDHFVDARTWDIVMLDRSAPVETKNDYTEKPYSYSSRTVAVAAAVLPP